MKASKQKKLKAAGWKVGDIGDFLGLAPEEVQLIELKVSMGQFLKTCRVKSKMTQEAFAKRISSSQSRVAKMEAGDPSVSFDLLVKSAFALGASTKDVARAMTRKVAPRKAAPSKAA